MPRLIKLDELTLKEHCYLEKEDNCYYFKDYTGGGVGYTYSEFNQLILNLKKYPSKKNTAEWNYKLKAIETVANWLAEQFSRIRRLQNITIVPIPPSKTKRHPEYDDRLLRILKMTEEKLELKLDIQELIINRLDRHPEHKAITRLTPNQLKEKYLKLENTENSTLREIILFDDILKDGAQYKASKDILSLHFPNTKIIGLFIGRRISYERREP